MANVSLTVQKNIINVSSTIEKNIINVSSSKGVISLSTGGSGLPGSPGSTWLQGNGIPNNSLGLNGDWYIDKLSGAVYKKLDNFFIEQFNFSTFSINDLIVSDGTTWSSAKLNTIDQRVKEIENTTFKGASTPTSSVDKGDTWYDTVNNIFYVYREYPIGSANFRWEPLIFKNDDTLDGGAF